MEQQKTETRSITAEQRKRVEEVCFRSLALIRRNCEYLEQHFDRTGADTSTRQAVADIDTAAMQLDRTLSEAITLLEFLHEDTKPQLYPIDLCELLQQVAAQSDMIRAQLGVDIRLDYGGCTACCVMADRRDAELLCLHLLSNALRASREGGSVCIALRRTESDWQLTVTDDGCGLPGEGCTGSAGKPPQLSGRGAAGAAALPGVLPPDGLELTAGACARKGHTGCGEHSAVHGRKPPRWHGGAAHQLGDRAGAAQVSSACHAGAGDAHHAGARRPGRRILIRWQGRCTAFCAAALLFCARCFPASAKHGILNAENKSLEEQQ